MDKGKEMVLAAKELEAAGISATLNTNDLVEVVANELYERFINGVLEHIKEGERLSKEYGKLLDAEFQKMKAALKSHLSGDLIIKSDDYEDDEDEEIEFGKLLTASFSQAEGEYWPRMALKKLSIHEKDKGTQISSSNEMFALPNFKSKQAITLLK